MPYADKEKQKEYQRKWTARKRKAIGGIVTFEELTRTDIKKIRSLKTWKSCVNEANALIGAVKGNRMKIVELCLQAVVITKGGDRRTQDWKDEGSVNTINAFAKEIGINYKTLHNWISRKFDIYDHLNVEEKKTFNFGAAKTARYPVDEDLFQASDTVGRYRELVNLNDSQRTSLRYLEEFRQAARYFTEHKPAHNLNEKQIERALFYLRAIQKMMKWK